MLTSVPFEEYRNHKEILSREWFYYFSKDFKNKNAFCILLTKISSYNSLSVCLLLANGPFYV